MNPGVDKGDHLVDSAQALGRSYNTKGGSPFWLAWQGINSDVLVHQGYIIDGVDAEAAEQCVWSADERFRTSLLVTSSS